MQRDDSAEFVRDEPDVALQADDIVRLKHMLDAAGTVTRLMDGRTIASLESDEIALLALVKCLENIGEAARQLSDQARRQMPSIPWPKVIGMRNHLVHVYFDIDLDVVWATATKAVPELADVVRAALAASQDAEEP